MLVRIGVDWLFLVVCSSRTHHSRQKRNVIFPAPSSSCAAAGLDMITVCRVVRSAKCSGNLVSTEVLSVLLLENYKAQDGVLISEEAQLDCRLAG